MTISVPTNKNNNKAGMTMSFSSIIIRRRHFALSPKYSFNTLCIFLKRSKVSFVVFNGTDFYFKC